MASAGPSRLTAEEVYQFAMTVEEMKVDRKWIAVEVIILDYIQLALFAASIDRDTSCHFDPLLFLYEVNILCTFALI